MPKEVNNKNGGEGEDFKVKELNKQKKSQKMHFFSESDNKDSDHQQKIEHYLSQGYDKATVGALARISSTFSQKGEATVGVSEVKTASDTNDSSPVIDQLGLLKLTDQSSEQTSLLNTDQREGDIASNEYESKLTATKILSEINEVAEYKVPNSILEDWSEALYPDLSHCLARVSKASRPGAELEAKGIDPKRYSELVEQLKKDERVIYNAACSFWGIFPRLIKSPAIKEAPSEVDTRVNKGIDELNDYLDRLEAPKQEVQAEVDTRGDEGIGELNDYLDRLGASEQEVQAALRKVAYEKEADAFYFIKDAKTYIEAYKSDEEKQLLKKRYGIDIDEFSENVRSAEQIISEPYRGLENRDQSVINWIEVSKGLDELEKINDDIYDTMHEIRQLESQDQNLIKKQIKEIQSNIATVKEIFPQLNSKSKMEEQDQEVKKIEDDPYLHERIEQVEDAIKKLNAYIESDSIDKKTLLRDWNKLLEANESFFEIGKHLYKSPESLRRELVEEVSLASLNLEKVNDHLRLYREGKIEELTLDEKKFNKRISEVKESIEYFKAVFSPQAIKYEQTSHKHPTGDSGFSEGSFGLYNYENQNPRLLGSDDFPIPFTHEPDSAMILETGNKISPAELAKELTILHGSNRILTQFNEIFRNENDIRSDISREKENIMKQIEVLLETLVTLDADNQWPQGLRMTEKKFDDMLKRTQSHLGDAEKFLKKKSTNRALLAPILVELREDIKVFDSVIKQWSKIKDEKQKEASASVR